MATRFNRAKPLLFLKSVAWILAIGAILLSFFFLPYYHAEKRLAWDFVWCVHAKEAIPAAATLQVAAVFVLVLFFLYLLRLRKRIHREKEELTAAITNLEVGFFRNTPKSGGEFIEANEAFLKMLGYDEEELFRFTAQDIFYQPSDYQKIQEALLSKGVVVRELRFKKKNGQAFWVMLSAKAIKNDMGEMRYFENMVMDISERKWMEEEVSSAYLRFEAVIQSSPNIAIQGYSLDGRILEWNHASELLFGYSKHEVIGKRGADLLAGENDRREFEEAVIQIAATGHNVAPHEARAKNRGGKEITLYSSLFPILQNGKVIEIYCMSVDISDRVETEKRLNEIKDKLESLALKDALTEIYNFRYFRERLAAEFERAKRSLSPMTVMMIDMDYFKSINDTYGHQFGDKILKQVARLLKNEFRTNDIVARWGGEEFAIILPDTNRSDGMSVANKLLQILQTRSFGDGSNVIKVKCSIGVVSYPEDPLFSVDEIIDAGEESIYRVKERGGNGIALYGHEIGERAFERYNSEDDRTRYIDSVKQKLSFFAVRSERSILEAIYSLAKSIELRDRKTKEHCERMVEYAEKMARQLGMNEQGIDNVRRAAMLHDIGKLGISDAILLKPARLTPQEYEVVKRHPVIGADIVSVAGFLKDIAPLILSHHERWDGTGYPRGLKGEEIPLGARIIAVVDVYEAVTSDRPYHKAISKEEACDIIKQGAGTQFDPQAVSVFLDIVG
ncbi:MAG: diguanylate cyclase [Candidatus Omnitrophota bacterium]